MARLEKSTTQRSKPREDSTDPPSGKTKYSPPSEPKGQSADKREGKLIVDATVAEQAIRFPTDFGLLNEGCEISERIIDELYHQSGLTKKPRTYRQKARKMRQREEYRQRIPIEGKFGQGKNGYRLNYIRAKVAKTSEAWIRSIFLVMNLMVLFKVFFYLSKIGGGKVTSLARDFLNAT